MTVEELAADMKRRHDLSSLHIFEERGNWRVFGSRLHPKGFQASVDDGKGPTIHAALTDLDTRLQQPMIGAGRRKMYD